MTIKLAGLREEVLEKMKELKHQPEKLSMVICEILNRHGDDLIDIAMQENLHWTTSDLYSCTMQQVAADVLDYELGVEYLREREGYDDERYVIQADDTGDLLLNLHREIQFFPTTDEAIEWIYAMDSRSTWDGFASFTVLDTWDANKPVSTHTIGQEVSEDEDDE